MIDFDFWTAYSPTWDVQGAVNSEEIISNRPPAYAGVTLGGLWRLRAFPAQRFSDKASIYFVLESRMTPKWNPFSNWPWLQKYIGIDWLQFAPFVEVGRVAPSWNAHRHEMGCRPGAAVVGQRPGGPYRYSRIG